MDWRKEGETCELPQRRQDLPTGAKKTKLVNRCKEEETGELKQGSRVASTDAMKLSRVHWRT